MVIPCDRSITVVLGANDHGKTNFLHALLHLNKETNFDVDVDLNWDCESESERLPRVSCEFVLEEEETEKLLNRYTLLELTNLMKSELEKGNIQYREAKSRLEMLQVQEQKLAETSTAHENEKAELEALEPNEADVSEIKSKINALHKSLTDIERQRKKIYRETGPLQRMTQDEQLNVDRLCAFQVILEFEAEERPGNAFVEKLAASKAALEEARNRLAFANEQHDSGVVELQEAQSSGEENKINEATEKWNQANIAKEKAERAVEEAVSFCERMEKLKEIGSDDEMAMIRKKLSAKVGKIRPPLNVVIERVGLHGERNIVKRGALERTFIFDYIKEKIPQFELIDPVSSIHDRVTADQLRNEEYDFLRGILYFAGISENEWEGLFDVTDVTMKRLSDASSVLNSALKESWSQGKELTFRLNHDSKAATIELLVEDPAVASRYVRISRRSAGFTQFFATKTRLHAREQEEPSNSFIWLFDEPGLYLHPHGQYDLIQVLETISKSSQIVYSTHSIFMINKNFPSRHRLLVKGDSGTCLDVKPYVAQWHSAIDALGLALPGTILFASKVLLVEGASDPIYINAMLQALIECGEVNFDINSLSVMSTGDGKNADAIIRILGESPLTPTIAALFDGDKGGKDRRKYLDKVMKEYSVINWCLDDGTSVEDHLLGVKEFLLPGVAKYVERLSEKEVTGLCDRLLRQFEARFPSARRSGTKGIGKWLKTMGKDLGELDQEPSVVGYAREYLAMIQDSSINNIKGCSNYKRAFSLIKSVGSKLSLPSQVLDQVSVIAED